MQTIFNILLSIFILKEVVKRRDKMIESMREIGQKAWKVEVGYNL